MSASSILLVEDDETLAMALSDALAQDGYRVERERDGLDALAKALSGRFDLVVLDLMLPRLDGFEICRRMRGAGVRTPVLMLTARGREEDRVKGLDLGADDYVVKPFSVRELLARIRARLRTTTPVAGTATVGEARIDFDAMRVRRADGVESDLTKTEAEILRLLAANPGRVLTRNRFLDEIWGRGKYPTTRTVDMHLVRVREKVGDDGAAPRFIKTIHGVGYRYDPPS